MRNSRDKKFDNLLKKKKKKLTNNWTPNDMWYIFCGNQKSNIN